MKTFNCLRVIQNLLLILSVLLILISCNKKPALVSVDPAFSKYIDAYTSGVVSKKNTIRIQLAEDANTTHTINETLKEKYFDFKPSIDGKAYWIDARTIEFKPDNDLKPDQLYQVHFNLDKALDVPKQFKDFGFNIQVLKPSFEVEEFGLNTNNKQTMNLTGELRTADVEDSKNIEKLLSAKLDNSALKVSWQHNEADKTHQFTINNINRSSKEEKLLLQWNGDALNANTKGEKEIAVPAIGDFKVMNVRAMQGEEQYALVQFSEPITVGQMLDGLVSIEGVSVANHNESDNAGEEANVSYTINNSEVKMFTGGNLDGGYTVNIHEGIEDQSGKKLSKSFTSNIYFETNLPAVKILGRGNILPNSSGKLVLPFDATNLSAVDVSIIKIYENNIAQFFQTNNLNGEESLRQVGKPITEATVRLDNDKTINLHKKIRFSLDLDKFIRTEPGAIYRVTIGFRPKYSLYTCDSITNEKEEDYYDESSGNNDEVDDDQNFWNRYDSYYPYGYNWEQRRNPCYSSYYNKEKFASRNILASNIGLTAKRASNGSLFVAANNIITTEPMKNVELEVLNYQLQIIAKATTDGDGLAIIETKSSAEGLTTTAKAVASKGSQMVGGKPYLLIAKQENERGYLKLDDGVSLPLSRFDVSGEEVQHGIKGFIFGERGVWRPGDSLFLSCIIDDKDNKLPTDHPIEMELVSPRGQLYKHMVQTNGENGFNVFRTATDADAPTGNWTCRVKAGGAMFEKRIKIETVMPNRLKIDLDFGNLTALGKDANITGTLSAKWLFGATAQNLKARVDAQLYKHTTTFSKFQDYVFDNPTAHFESQSKTIFDETLSDEGTAPINPSFTINEEAPGQLLANLVVKVFEPGGNFSIDNISMPFNPYSSYIGVKAPEGDKTWGFLQSGKTHRFDVADVNTQGVPVSGSTNVEVQLYKIQWRWWWDNGYDDALTNFTQDEYNKLIKKDEITLNNGRSYYDLKMDDSQWGRYLILLKDKRSGHTTGITFYVDDYSWQSRTGLDNDVSAASMLSFTSDKEKYNVGDNVNLTIPSSKGGRALISIESGSKVIKTYWVNTEQGQSKFSFKAEKEMSPNVYVNVSLIQPHAQTINDLPIRMYGVIPILIDDKNTVLKPVIKVADVIRPETNTSITVSEASGKSMSYVIAIVDEGLLDLTRFKTPNPHDAFYAREALGVKSWDLYDDVIGAWAAQIERILTIGGDAEGELASKTRRANRFKPVVQFMGPFTSSGGSKTHNFTLPAYMGSVKAMVIAAGNNAFGMAEKSITVKKPLMVLTTLPRVLAPTEEIKIPVTVFATENNIHNVTLTLQSNPFIEAAGTQNVIFTKPGEQLVYFTARVKSTTGIGNIKITASSGNEKSVSETEIDIRNPNQPVTQISEATLQPNQSWNTTVAMIGDASTSKAVLEISSIPAINLQKRLDYLIAYPHGCIEQITSACFPQITLNQLLELSDNQKKEIDRNIRIGIQKLQNFQQSDGSFSYWPGQLESDEWGTSYAGNFLLEASNFGYNVPSSMLQQWKQFERTKARAWNVTTAPYYGTDLEQAYRLYLLALAKSPEQGAMNRLKEWKFLTPEAKWRLAAAYYLTGQSQVALQLISNLPTSFPQRKEPGFTYGSDLRDQAMVLETLTIMNRKSQASQLVRTIAARLSQDQWYSTQTTAYCLIAIAKFSGSNKDNSKIVVNGKVSGDNLSINSAATVAQQNVKWQNGKGSIQFANNGSNVLYVRVLNSGQPVSFQPMTIVNNPEVLQVNVVFTTSAGKTIMPDSIKQGTDFVAKVTVKNPGMRGVYEQMALSELFPGGWEILNTRLYNNEGAFQSSPAEYMDIRDDRVYFYFDINPGETLTYYVQLNAAYPGKYIWSGIYCEAMYQHEISGGVGGKWVVVK